MNRQKKWVGIILVLLLLIGGVLFFIFKPAGISTSSGFSKIFIEEIFAGKADKTYDLLTDQLKSTITKSEWAEQVNDATTSYDTWKITGTSDVKEPEKTYGKGAEAINVRYEITSNKIPYIMETVIVKKDESWKVNEILGYKK